MQGVVGGVASVMMLLQLSYLSFSWESILHPLPCKSEMIHRQNFNIVHENSGRIKVHTGHILFLSFSVIAFEIIIKASFVC